MRAVPVASRTPSVAVKLTRKVPGVCAAKSKDADPPTIVAVAAASPWTRTDASEIVPAVPVTWGVTSTVSPASIVSTTAKDCTVRAGSSETVTVSGRVLIWPAVSETVTVSSTTSSPVPPPPSLCW